MFAALARVVIRQAVALMKYDKTLTYTWIVVDLVVNGPSVHLILSTRTVNRFHIKEDLLLKPGSHQ